MIDALLSLGFVVMLIALGLGLGRIRERSHIRELDRREEAVAAILLTDVRTIPPSMAVRAGELVSGEAVIATDYWKTFVAQLRAIVGGEVKSLGTLMDRARREARLRMVEAAAARGASAIINVRIETSEIGGGRAPITEVFAYGTALYA